MGPGCCGRQIDWELAAAGRDPLAGPLRLGAIYTIGPYLLPKLIPILRRVGLALRKSFPRPEAIDALRKSILACHLPVVTKRD